MPLAHLDRPFDYLVPAELDADAVPGTRVKVRFAGQLVDGWLLERADDSGHTGRLAYLEKVVSPEPVLAPEVARLARAVADRYAGSLADVLRLAVPPRHARVEKDVRARDADAPARDADAPARDADAPAGDARGAAVSGGDAAALEGGPTAFGGGSSVPDDGPAEVAVPEVAVPGAAVPADAPAGAGPVVGPGPDAWRDYPAGPALLRALADGRAPRAVWSALPGEDWPARYAEAVAATVAGGRGAVVVVADNRDLDRLDAALQSALGPGRHVCLSAALGPARRYRAFLAARRGDVSVVVGTRAAMFAPVARLGLVAIWDDGDDLHAEPRAPYPHAREVLLTRAQLGDAAALVGGFARTAEAQLLVETGWAREVVADRATLRARMPAIAPTGDDPQLARDPGAATARLPSLAWTTAREAIRADLPVLVQVPRRGYLPSVACAECRTPARCPHCAGPLALPSAEGSPACRWCGRVAAAYACPECGGRRLRASVTGARRTAEELGRAFPGVPVRTSGREEVLATVPGGAGLVIATPGAEPVAEGGFGAVLLLDSWALLTRADLRAGEEALRRWLAAAALARPAAGGGRVVVVADGALAPVQALLRWDAAWFAARELAERRELGFPPAVRMASVTGPPAAVADLLAEARLPAEAELLGPVPADGERERMLVRVPRARAAALAGALHSAAGVRTARKAVDPVRLQVDPLSLF
ncbi:primosomal protein N' [Micromonospora sp. NPDC047465]|uniref:primosomal protein N' n=1 Tax=Micromonospora sp. NPDC047465 TaxID=3154813 RepID=UPI0033DF0E87